MFWKGNGWWVYGEHHYQVYLIQQQQHELLQCAVRDTKMCFAHAVRATRLHTSTLSGLRAATTQYNPGFLEIYSVARESKRPGEGHWRARLLCLCPNACKYLGKNIPRMSKTLTPSGCGRSLKLRFFWLKRYKHRLGVDLCSKCDISFPWETTLLDDKASSIVIS